MTRITSISTYIGLLGLVLSMVAALAETVSPGALLFGFILMLTGMFGAVFGAAASWSFERARSN